MSYYTREEQETFYNYDPLAKQWRVYSCYPPHVRKLMDYATAERVEYDNGGKPIAFSGWVDANQVRLYKPRLQV